MIAVRAAGKLIGKYAKTPDYFLYWNLQRKKSKHLKGKMWPFRVENALVSIPS